MPDIAMCKEECPSSTTCFRHQDSGTKPDKFRQGWVEFKVDQNTGKCDYYWGVRHESK